VIRTKLYTSLGDFRTKTEIATPSDRGDDTGRTSGERVLRVQDVPVASVEVSPSFASINVGGAVSLDAIMRDASGNILTGRTVTWQSDNPSIVSVPSLGDPGLASGQAVGTAQITATSESVNGYATVEVIPVEVDDADSAGNNLPFEINNGDFVSVTVTMLNTGTSTWRTATGYQLIISQGGQYWMPGQAPLTFDVGTGIPHPFTFDLGLDDPFHTGDTPCYWQMIRADSLFGEENGRMIYVYSHGAMSATEAGAQETAAALEEIADHEGWLVGARATEPARFGPGVGQLSNGEAQLLTYRYDHAVPRTLDVVFRIVVDPAVAEVLPPRVDTDGTRLRWRVSSGSPGEYWVRLTGSLPAGTGSIGAFPVRVLTGKAATGELGTVTLYYPPN
jgi:hypothetical protein